MTLVGVSAGTHGGRVTGRSRGAFPLPAARCARLAALGVAVKALGDTVTASLPIAGGAGAATARVPGGGMGRIPT